MAHFKRFQLVSLAALSFAMPALAQTPPADGKPAAAPAAAGPQAAEERRGPDVILVTANKREESIEDVAIAITAVTAEQRDTLGIQTTQDLTNITPGLQYTQGNERVFLRGVGRNTNNFGAEPGVANYTDGIYESFATISGREPIFIDRIEVLRGPQGTLYGRNSIGGLINTISKRPTDQFEAEFHTGFGNLDERKVQASISGPLGFGGIKYRLVGAKEVREKGFFYNYATGDTEGGNINDYTIEGQLAGDIGDRFSWWVKGDTGGYHKAGSPGGRTAGASNAPYNTTFGNIAGADGEIIMNPGWALSGSPSVISYTQSGTFVGNPGVTDRTKLNDNVRNEANLDGYNDYAAEMVYRTDLFDVKYTGGYVYYDYNLYGDYPGTPINTITYWSNPASGAPVAPTATGAIQRTVNLNGFSHYRENRAFFSNELNFISTYDSPLQWIAGIYQYQENFAQEPQTTLLPDEPLLSSRGPAYGPGFSVLGLSAANPDRKLVYDLNSGNNNSYGAYGQLDWAVTDQWKLTGGLRYSFDQKHMQEFSRLNCLLTCFAPFSDITRAVWTGKAFDPNNPTVEVAQAGILSATPTNLSGVTTDTTTGISTRVLGNTWSAITGNAGFEWTPTKDTLLFAKYSRGYKAGGFNAQSMAARPQTDAEHMNAYEAGWKQQWRDWGLTTNLAVFFYDYRNAQTPLTVVPPPPAQSYTSFFNVPKEESKGVELESNWSPIDNLSLSFTYAYLDAKVKDGGGNVSNPLTGVAVSIDGKQLPQSPKNKIALNANYRFAFADSSELIPSISYYWRDKFASDIFNNAITTTQDFAQTDARMTWNSGGGHFTWIGFVRNAFDDTGYDGISASRRRSTGQVYSTITPTPPRTYGVEFQFHFK